MKQYLRNPYIVVGLIGCSFYIWKKWKLNKVTPKKTTTTTAKVTTKDTKNETDNEKLSFINESVKKVANANGVPQKLVRDVAKMPTKKIARTILVNQRMLNKEKMSNDKRHHILKMISYMESELEERTK
jgi:hypothetical protein